MSKVAVITVGGGGIGSAALQDLSRFLSKNIDLYIVDGDTVEGKNVHRQMFSQEHIGRNKAECLQEIIVGATGLDRVYYRPEYITGTELLDDIAEKYDIIVLLGCVDNHPARRHMEAFARQTRCCYYVDGANSKLKGEVVATYVHRGAVSGFFRSEIDSEVATDNSGDPTKLSCGQQLDAGETQVLFTNRKAAIIMLELVDKFMNVGIETGIVYFDECKITRLKPHLEGVVDDGSESVGARERAA